MDKIITVYVLKHGEVEKNYPTKSKAISAQETLKVFGYESEIKTDKITVTI